MPTYKKIILSGHNVSELTNNAGYLTSHQSLANYTTVGSNISQFANNSGYATQSWVNSQGFLKSQTDSQTLSISGKTLSISSGNSITLPTDNNHLTSIRQTASDGTPAGVQFNNSFVAPSGSTRSVYFDGGAGNGSVSTWYGVGNKPYGAIDVSQTYVSIWTNNSSGAWNRMFDVFGDHSLVRANVNFQSTGIITASGGDSTSWNTAYGWGNHADAGYLTSVPSSLGATNFTGDVTITTTNNLTVGNINQRGSITAQGGNNGYVNGAFVTSSANSHRGGGLFMLDRGSANEWFIGRPYSGNDSLIFARATGSASHSGATAQRTNSLMSISNSGVVSASSFYINSAGNSTNWTSAYNWGNHASVGYATDYGDPRFTSALKTRLDSVSMNADVTPSWVPNSDPGYGTSNLTLSNVQSYIEGDDGIRSVRFDFQDYGSHWNTNDGHSTNNPMSIKLWDSYNDQAQSGLDPYGTILDIYGRQGHERDQFFFGNTGTIRHRNIFYGTNTWNAWKKIWDNSDLSDTVVDSLKTNYNRWLTSHQDISGKANLSGFTMTGAMQTNTVTNYALLTGHTGGLRIRSSHSGSAGVQITDINNTNQIQLYGTGGTRYGFLHAEWGNWDFRKEVGGRIYTNNQTTYYLQPETTSVLKTLEVATSLVTSGSITMKGSLGIYTAGGSDSISINPDANLYLGTSGTDRTHIGASTRPVSINGVCTFGQSTSGINYNDLSNKPTIPTNNNQLTNGAGFITGLSYSSLTSKPVHIVNNHLSGRTTNTPDTTGDSYGVTFNYAGTSAGIPGTDHSLMTMAYSSAWQTQVAQDWRNHGRMYVRSQNNGTWGSWYQQWSSHDFSQTAINNWNTAYGWGNHASQGYLTSHQSLSAYATTSSPTFSGHIRLSGSGRIIGGFGAVTTAGTTDWNHDTNAISGQGYTLLTANATNGHGFDGDYYHPFNWEYARNDGQGNMTQLAVPYSGTGAFAFRTRYSGTWTNWRRIIDTGIISAYADKTPSWLPSSDPGYLTSSSTIDADTLSGLPIHTGWNNQANRIMRTDSNGYANFGWIYTVSGATNHTGMNRVYASYDGYLRYYTPTEFGKAIGQHISYSSLAGKPTIPTNNNQLTNGAGYITSSALSNYTTSGSNISQFANNSGYLTSHQDISGKANLSGATFTGHVDVASSTPFLYVGDGTANNDSNWDSNIMLDSNAHSRLRIENRGTNSNLEIYSHTGIQPTIRATDSSTSLRLGVGGTISATIGTNPYLTVHGETYLNDNAVLRTNNKHLYGVTSGGATVQLIGLKTNNWIQLGGSGYGIVTGDGNFSVTGGIAYGSKFQVSSTNNSDNWNTAYGWGNHASAGYVTTDTNTTYSAGTGVTLSGTTFSIGQAVSTTSNVRFADITANNISYSGKLRSTSDLRLKENIKEIPRALDSISKLKGVTFDWKANKQSDYGVIAQEVEQVFPDLVFTDQEQKGIKSVDYIGMIPILIESIKELKNEMKTLKTKCNCKGD